MNDRLKVARAWHDAAVLTGAKCGPGCMFNKAVFDAHDKGRAELRARVPAVHELTG